MAPVTLTLTGERGSLHSFYWNQNNQAVLQDPDYLCFRRAFVPHLPLNMSISLRYRTSPSDIMPCSPYTVFPLTKYYGTEHEKWRCSRGEQLND